MHIGGTIVFEGSNYIIVDVSSDEVDGRKLIALTLNKEEGDADR